MLAFITWGLSLTPRWLYLSMGTFSYTSRTDFFFYWGVSLTDAVLALIYQVSFSYTSHVGFIFIWGVCFTHPMLV